MVHDSGVNPVCCKEEMKQLRANTVDASKEKHVPSVKVNNNRVEVVIGEVIHPMVESHYIEWIYLETKKGSQIKMLKPGEEPKAVFVLEDDTPMAVYEYCNLHGLWKKSI
jgi:superoxide reductase